MFLYFHFLFLLAFILVLIWRDNVACLHLYIIFYLEKSLFVFLFVLVFVFVFVLDFVFVLFLNKYLFEFGGRMLFATLYCYLDSARRGLYVITSPIYGWKGKTIGGNGTYFLFLDNCKCCYKYLLLHLYVLLYFLFSYLPLCK